MRESAWLRMGCVGRACLSACSGRALRRAAASSARCSAALKSCCRASAGRELATAGSGSILPEAEAVPPVVALACLRTIREVGSAEETKAEVANQRERWPLDLIPLEPRAAMRMAAVVDSSGEMCERYELGSRVRSIESSIAPSVS